MFVAHTPGMGGMTQARLEARSEPLRWPCPTLDHPGVSTLYLDHASWYAAAAALGAVSSGGESVKRFLTPSGKVELTTQAIESKLSAVGQSGLPVFYMHPEVTGRNPTLEYTSALAQNPVNPRAVTPVVKIGKLSTGEVHKQFPLMGMSGRPSVVHFSSATHWTRTGKLMNGVRLVQIHPRAAGALGIAQGDSIIVESPRGAVTGTAELWDGIREDTIFVPNTFGPAQAEAQELGTPLYTAANTLLDDRYFDNLSGQQAYKCFACRVRKA